MRGCASAFVICVFTFVTPWHLAAQRLTGPALQLEVSGKPGAMQEMFSIRDGGHWIPVLGAGAAVYVRAANTVERCNLTRAEPSERGLLLSGECGSVGDFEQHLSLTPEDDVIDVSTRFTVKPGVVAHSIEDRYNFMPDKHRNIDEHMGPLDFVWSQNIKSEADDLIPTEAFKSPAIMMQQGSVFAALLPAVNDRLVETRALDLDVTSDARPWIAYGAISSEPHGHSYFRRTAKTVLHTIAGTVEYRYSLVLSAQPIRLGYRRVTHLLWQRIGHPALLVSSDEQQNVLRPELSSFDDWRKEAWATYADRVYSSFPCGNRLCGTLSSDRNPNGDWENREPDAWFNAWFETLRTAYGWYVHGRAIHDSAMMGKAESVLNLALSSPRKGGAFSTIYLLKGARWLPGDGWASYEDSYNAFSMSWTAYWMLRWAEDLTPERKAEVLRFVRPYADFLVANQLASGVIPSWYEARTLEPRTEFRNFNAETAPSALLLATLGLDTGDARYTAAAEHAMAFVEREVVPRARWFDFETFLSCARKEYAFFDPWTAQYPQNNLAEMQAPQAMLTLYRATHKAVYLKEGTEMLDYLLLTQQVWNNPQFTPRLLGGFTTQNTDAEWSDARQAYAATLLADFYETTGTFEYLERSVAAARSTFAVAPWENWAHTGYIDEPGALTGFHWGTGSAMTSIEALSPLLGDALIDLNARQGVGFDECTLTALSVHNADISFRLTSSRKRIFTVRFAHVTSTATYRIRVNDTVLRTITGDELMRDGFQISMVP